MGLAAKRSYAKKVVSSLANSVCQFVLAGAAARLTVHQAIGAQAYVELGLAVHAVFVAQATLFSTLAISAQDAA